jgi:pimeloyl-ACP methyl ester carboxylesterase
MEQYRRGNMVFDVIDAGPADGPVVVLLHGFPQFNTSWQRVIPYLVAHGYRCLAPNQRGYSRGARPTRRGDYRVSELVEDVRALIDASGAQRVHLVGYDWGAAVTWAVAASHPGRLKTMAALSMPHPAALFRALASPRQTARLWYVGFFQLPHLPELLLTRRVGDSFLLSRALRWSHQTRKNSHRDAAAVIETGALTGAINWYRAIPLSYRRDAGQRITVPALFVWSDADTALGSKAAHGAGRYVTGEYRFEILNGVSHWVLDDQPDPVAELLLEWFAGHAS